MIDDTFVNSFGVNRGMTCPIMIDDTFVDSLVLTEVALL